MNDRCYTCGDEGTSYATVQRIYIRYDDHGRPTGEFPADEFETWCAVCCTIYPHELVQPD